MDAKDALNATRRSDDNRTRLSTLWVVVMFNMVFADILTFIKPGALQEGILQLVMLVQEMVMAAWLIAKGFNTSAIAPGAAKTPTSEPLGAA